jgi:hypothetical protein
MAFEVILFSETGIVSKAKSSMPIINAPPFVSLST